MREESGGLARGGGTRRVLAILAALAMVAVACGGGEDAVPITARNTDRPVTTTGGSDPDPDATTNVRQPTVIPKPDLSGRSFLDNLATRVDDGDWTLEEGLVATLQLFTGEAEPDTVLRHGAVFEREISDVVELAAVYLANGADEATKTELGRLLNRHVWAPEALDAMAGIGPTADATLLVAAGPLAAAQFSQNCEVFFHGYDVEGVSTCLEAESKVFGGQDYRVYKPAPGLPDAGWTAEHRTWVFAAIRDTVDVYTAGGLGALPGARIVFSTVKTIVELDTGIDPPVGIAEAAPVKGELCGIALHRGMQSYNEADFKQIVSHELAHCLQRQLFDPQTSNSPRSWWTEGQAEYLANLVYPTNNLEHDRIPHSNLEAHELSTTLFDRRYSNFIFFQYLVNRRGIAGMFGVISALPASGGRPAQEKSLAVSVGAELFQEFAEAVTDKKVIDSGGGPIPYEMSTENQPEVQLTSEGVPLFDLDLAPFGVFRRKLIVESGEQACLEDSSENAIGQSRPEPPAPWYDLQPVLPLSNEAPRELIVVATAVEDGAYRLDVPSVHSLQQAAGGDGVVGRWVLYNTSVHAKVEYIAPVQRVTSIGGQVVVTFREDGTVDVEFDGFSVEGNSDVQLEDGVYFSDYTVGYSSITNASGTTGYEVKGDYVFYDDLFTESYLRGVEEIQQAREGTFLRIETENRLLEIDAVPLEYEVDAAGWAMFSAAEEVQLLCGGKVLRLNSAIFRYDGPPEG